MDQDLAFVSDNLLELGVGFLAQAQRNTLFGDNDPQEGDGVWGVLHAARAGDLIIKAAIAKQHPLLIFSTMPDSGSTMRTEVSIRDVVENATPLEYTELPERLWAATGYQLPGRDAYEAFGRLQNSVNYFGALGRDLRKETANYIYQVIDPILDHFWDDYATNYIDVPEAKKHIFELLTKIGMADRINTSQLHRQPEALQ